MHRIRPFFNSRLDHFLKHHRGHERSLVVRVVVRLDDDVSADPDGIFINRDLVVKNLVKLREMLTTVKGRDMHHHRHNFVELHILDATLRECIFIRNHHPRIEDDLRQLLRGKVCAFTGNSGVGKSSILNRLVPGAALPTALVSEKLGRGKHTTRHVELFQLDENSYAADTPGFASFEIELMKPIPKEQLQFDFPEFAPDIGSCLFQDCSHRREPGCAVRGSVEAGRISESRYRSYLRLYDQSAQLKDWERKEKNT